MRILVTASRNWTDARAIEDALLEATRYAFNRREQITVVHGDCPTGGDRITVGLCRYHGWEEEPHPCDKECVIHGRAHMWATLGKAAGPIRNQAMAFDGADICLAFPLGKSSGTRDCMRRAQDAGIPVINFGDPA
jgi:hypothetical protein